MKTSMVWALARVGSRTVVVDGRKASDSEVSQAAVPV